MRTTIVEHQLHPLNSGKSVRLPSLGDNVALMGSWPQSSSLLDEPPPVSLVQGAALPHSLTLLRTPLQSQHDLVACRLRLGPVLRVLFTVLSLSLMRA